MTKMRLSDAMRLGSTLSQQGYGGHDENRCALQAVQDALGLEAFEELGGVAWGQLWEAYPFISYAEDSWKHLPKAFEIRCPECLGPYTAVGMLIAACLNDKHKWDRLKIADWIEQAIEIPLEQEAAEKVAKAGLQCSSK